MTREIPPLHRPNDLPPPYQREKVEVKDDGTIKKRKVWDYCDDDLERQQYALWLLRKTRAISEYSKGGQPGARVVHNIIPHQRAWTKNGDKPWAFYMLDLKDAFPNTDRNEVGYHFYRILGKSAVGLTADEQQFLEVYMHEDIGAFLTLDGVDVKGVPQGNATSGVMLDVLLNETDKELGKWLPGVYTRWIDDLTFSTSLVDPLTGLIEESAVEYIQSVLSKTPGVIINDNKTQLLSGEKAVTVTGVTFSKYGLRAPSAAILEHVTKCFDELREKLITHGKLTEHDINVFDGYRAALAIAGPPERSSSKIVTALYHRSIRLGSWAYKEAANQGVITPRARLGHAGPKKQA